MKLKQLLIITLLIPFFISLVSAETDLNYQGYIIEFEEKPLLDKKSEFQKIAERNEERFVNKIPGIGAVYRNFATTNENVNDLVDEYSEDLKISRQQTLSEVNRLTDQDTQGFRTTSVGENNQIELEYIINAISMNLPDDKIEEIKEIEGVKSIQPNYEYEFLLEDAIPLMQEGLEAGKMDMYGNNCYESENECLTGKGVKIAIIDSGVDYTHPDLGNCSLTDNISDGSCGKVIGGYDFVQDQANPMDNNGHGTHVAATAAGNGSIKGIAPNAKILAYKVGDIFIYADAILASIEQAILDDADILSLSLGGPGTPNSFLSKAVDRAVEEGKTVVVAAGNSGNSENAVGNPGNARKVISVGASDKQDNIAFFSSTGPVTWEENETNYVMMKPDVVAPGLDIYAAVPGDSRENKSGTSMSTPLISGLVALLIENNPELSPTEIKTILQSNTEDLGSNMYEQGMGRVRANDIFETKNQPVLNIKEAIYTGDYIEIQGIIDLKEQDSYSIYIRSVNENNTWKKVSEGTNSKNGSIYKHELKPCLGEKIIKVKIGDYAKDYFLVDRQKINMHSKIKNCNDLDVNVNVIAELEKSLAFSGYEKIKTVINETVTLSKGEYYDIAHEWNQKDIRLNETGIYRVVVNAQWNEREEEVIESFTISRH